MNRDNRLDRFLDQRRKDRSMQRFLDKIKTGSRPHNILILGPYGAGKSSFINTISTSFSGEWEPHAYAGNLGDVGSQTTFHIRTFNPKCCMTGNNRHNNYPTLIDTQGFDHNVQDVHRKLLECLLNGYLSDGESIKKAAEVYEDFKNSGLHGEEGLQAEYAFFPKRKIKIDRVIFLASAVTDPPLELLDLVRTTTNSPKRAIPLYGVLTHMDKVGGRQRAFDKCKQLFKCHLGLTNERFLECTNYCDDLYSNESGQSHPSSLDIDIPVIEFMTEVCNPVTKAIHHEETQRCNPCLKAGIVMFSVFCLVFVAIILERPSDFNFKLLYSFWT
ncbi:uncharacterized protein LOC125647524 [Ostrea edulis]|uniref:uncharacterized protein LOC125647524 n=1 Tax=Ostrea edulis TaxID=37623 RepID=UPI0024AFD558|nr:uncharacterized protein LOC125647524 [Ostrea edulis]